MSESSKIRGKNTAIFRTSTLLTATAIWSFANGVSAQDAASTDTAKSDAPGFAGLKRIVPLRPLKLPSVLRPKFFIAKPTLLPASVGV